MNKSEVLRQLLITLFVFVGIQFTTSYFIGTVHFAVSGSIGLLLLGLAFFILHRGIGLGIAISGATDLLVALPNSIKYKYFLPIVSWKFLGYFLVISLVGYLFYKRHSVCCINLNSEKFKIGVDNTLHKKIMIALMVICASLGFYFSSEYAYSDIQAELTKKAEEFFKGYELVLPEGELSEHDAEKLKAGMKKAEEWQTSDVFCTATQKINNLQIMSFMFLQLSALIALYLGVVFINSLMATASFIMSLALQVLAVASTESGMIMIDFSRYFFMIIQLLSFILTIGIIIWLSYRRNKINK